MRKLLFVLIVLFGIALLLGSIPVFAEEEEERQLIQELFITETVYPQDMGEVQFTLWPKYWASGPEGDLFQLAGTVEYGFTDHWQIEATWIGYQNLNPAEEDEDNQEGIGDLELGTKYAFSEIEALGLTTALGFEVTLPTGDIDKELTEGFRVYEPFIIFSKDFENGFNIHLHLAYGILDREKEPEDDDEELEPEVNELEANLAFIYPFTDTWRATLELNLETNEIESDGEETEAFITPGIIWEGPGTWELGIGVPIGLTDDSPDWAVVAMITYEFDMPWAE